MFQINENYLKLPGSYLFSEIAARVGAYSEKNPAERLIRMGIGDVTRPLVPEVVQAMKDAADEMGRKETFRGYGPEQGYAFLREKIAEHDYKKWGVSIAADEIFVSDGAKSDTGNIGDILSVENTVAVCDPVYPVYVDTNAMAGRAGNYGADGKWDRLIYMPCTRENGFMPDLPGQVADVIYLCYPNNPTGGAATKETLQQWVAYALKNGSLILYDSAYESYISEEGLPHSIFEIDGAKSCAIEFRSFSKTAGFTGTRCAYAVVPKDLKCSGVSLRDLWSRRQGTKMNGVSYVVQKGAEATFSAGGRKAINETIRYYLDNAGIILDGLKKAGFEVWGGVNAPYIWLKTPEQISSWEFFDSLLARAGVIGTPGSGFGPSGEGYFRLTAFSSREDTIEAIERISSIQW